MAKKNPKLQKLFKNWPKSSIYLIIFHISFLKNPGLDIDLFSRTFDMELPKCPTIAKKMPCHHDFFKMSHHRASTKYGENTSFNHKEIMFRPKTALMLLSLTTLTNLTLNISKTLYFVCFSRMYHHRAPGWWDIPEISKQDSEKFRRSYKINKNINYMLFLNNWHFLG